MIIGLFVALGVLSVLFIWQAHAVFSHSENENKRGLAVLVMIVGGLSLMVMAEGLVNEVRPDRSGLPAGTCFGQKAIELTVSGQIHCMPYTEAERQATREAIADEILRDTGYR